MSVVIDSIRNENGYYVLVGRVSNGWKHAFTYWAANPADHRLSFTGSGIPFPNPEVAFENTPNRGVVKSETGSFEIQIQYPNAFYMGLGKEYVEPSIFFQVGDVVSVVRLTNGIPFRMVSHPPAWHQKGPLFYDRSRLPNGRTQEQILRDSGYPLMNQMPENHWGNAVPHP